MASLERRIIQLEERNEAGNELDFAELLREARLRAIRGERPPERPINQEMLDDPVSGEMWRKLRAARECVRRAHLLRLETTP
jgi:hypothetical protein